MRDYFAVKDKPNNKVVFQKFDGQGRFTAFPFWNFNKEKFLNDLGHLSFDEVRKLIEDKWHKEKDYDWFKGYEN